MNEERPLAEKVKSSLLAFIPVFILSVLAVWLSQWTPFKVYGLEYVFWAIVFGLLISNTIGFPEKLKAGLKTEAFIKIGLVLLGAEIVFSKILAIGVPGMIQALFVIILVWYFAYYISLKLGLNKSFAAVLASAVSICGVSAAIAAGGAVKGNKKEVAYVISIVVLVAIPMLLGMPFIARELGLSPAVAGAWIGGTIDTTPAVVAAGELVYPKEVYGDAAAKTSLSVASVVKLSQNALIGVVAFLLALYWTLRVERSPGEKPGLLEIWYRFPKFILGFVLASLFVSTGVFDPTISGITRLIRGWFFAFAFVSIGLDTNFKELLKLGVGKPALAFITAQVFNIIITLVLAYILFGILFPVKI
ncbi:MAG: YeiH family protein [Euryarchaeota archaeon]|nr:YeiH family protein [Euryarchaeota archaeon]